MNIILVKDVKGVGRSGQAKEVAEGFARNFLIPKKLAVIGTEAVLKSKQAEISKTEERLQGQAEAAAGALKNLAGRVYHFTLSADKNGHLYAGLKESEILAKIRQGAQTLPKILKLASYSPIKATGNHEVTVEMAGVGSAKTKVSIKAKN